ncbi:BTAD domain-containing putative transcriptional regulator [Mycolicibacterium sp. BiH015]|uniref:BTAD domain-containing putative transcriptional regulator n=1 Tax=Mycolicibacterium sp. BiH015 TaxID=3018808 RepID=UPI0022E6AF0D|nr:BTAD domain-containing putative transcriptional regulator [Mycolicibacterium sp. BiH015]MDA2889879.1 BTAD domain-containing putative transcriptional regulator [Mycolicibacterium sp. BiH015]
MATPGPAFTVLGPLQMSVGDSPIPAGTPKQRAVLAALLVNRNRVVATDSFVSAVWGEDPPSESRASLHAYISNLRRLFRTGGADGRDILQKAAPGYRLVVADANVDLGRFNQRRSEGLEAAAVGRFEDASTHFEAALSEWRGEFLEDLRDFAFVEALAVALTEDKVSVHTMHAQAEIACGRAESVISGLEKLVAAHPFREPLWAQLMTAYYVTRRQSDALEAFRRLKSLLAQELGIDPDPSVRDLHDAILQQQPLNVERSAKTTAADTLIATAHHLAFTPSAGAALRTDAGTVYPVAGPVTRIGRHSGNDVVMTDPRASRYHAVILYTGAGHVINDAGSANGIMLQGTKVQGSAALADGDRITIGDTALTFEIDRSSGE